MKFISTGAALVAAVTTAGVAWGSWHANGVGRANAAAGTMIGLTAVGSTVPGKLLYPGGTGDLVLDVTNDNSFPVIVSTLVQDGPAAADGGHPTCVTTGVQMTPSFAFTATTVPGGHQTTRVVVQDAVTMSNASDPGCQGATFTIPILIQGIGR